MNEKLDWVEKAAMENLRLHHQTADILAKESQVTLTVLLAGMAASLAYWAKAVDAGAWGWLAVGAFVFAAHWTWLAFRLVRGCLMIGEIPSIYNEPRNLMQADFDLDAIRLSELTNVQARIDQAAERNDRTAYRLNKIRLGAAITPLISLFCAWGSVMLAV